MAQNIYKIQLTAEQINDALIRVHENKLYNAGNGILIQSLNPETKTADILIDKSIFATINGQSLTEGGNIEIDLNTDSFVKVQQLEEVQTELENKITNDIQTVVGHPGDEYNTLEKISVKLVLAESNITNLQNHSNEIDDSIQSLTASLGSVSTQISQLETTLSDNIAQNTTQINLNKTEIEKQLLAINKNKQDIQEANTKIVEHTNSISELDTTVNTTIPNTYINKNKIGAANGLAQLDSTGKVLASQLPSYVDDVIEVANYDSLPETGESGKIYITIDTNKTYRWSGTIYAEISAGDIIIGDIEGTAYDGAKGKKNAEDIQQLNTKTSTIESSITNIDKDIQTLKTEDESQNTKISKLTTDYNDLNSNVSAHSTHLADLDQADININKNINDFKSEVQIKNQDIDKSIQTINETDKTQNSDILALKTWKGTTTSAITGITQDITELKNSNTNRDSLISTNKQNISNLNIKYTNLNDSYSRIDSTVKEHTRNITTNTESIATINQELDTLPNTYINKNKIGVASGIAQLDSTGKILSAQLPSYVDDVIEVASYNALPPTGESGKIYITIDTNKTYRWSGSSYIEITSGGIVIGDIEGTAYDGAKGKKNAEDIQLVINDINGLTPKVSTNTKNITDLQSKVNPLTTLPNSVKSNTENITKNAAAIQQNTEKMNNMQTEIDSISTDNFVSKTLIGSASGIATLDENTKVPESQIPTKFIDNVYITKDEYSKLEKAKTLETDKLYIITDINKIYKWSGINTYIISDVIAANSIENFPVNGQWGKIYLDTTTNGMYLYNSKYIQINKYLSLGEEAGTAYDGLKGKQNSESITNHNSRITLLETSDKDHTKNIDVLKTTSLEQAGLISDNTISINKINSTVSTITSNVEINAQNISTNTQNINKKQDTLTNGSVTETLLATDVQQKLSKANNALQTDDIADWAKNPKKPEYTILEINGLTNALDGKQNTITKNSITRELLAEDAVGTKYLYSGGFKADNTSPSTLKYNETFKKYAFIVLVGFHDGYKPEGSSGENGFTAIISTATLNSANYQNIKLSFFKNGNGESPWDAIMHVFIENDNIKWTITDYGGIRDTYISKIIGVGYLGNENEGVVQTAAVSR